MDSLMSLLSHDTTELTCSATINQDLFNQLIGNSNRNPKYTLYYSIDIWRPVRRNKRKRIQKKWLKRYGTKIVGKQRKRLDGLELNPSASSREGEFEFICK